MDSYTRQAGEQGSGNGSGMGLVGGMRSGRSQRMGLGLRIVMGVVGLVIMAGGLHDLVGAMPRREGSEGTEQAVHVEVPAQRGGELQLRREEDEEFVDEWPSEAQESRRGSRLGQLPGTALRPEPAGYGPTDHIALEDGGVFLMAEVPAAWSDQVPESWMVDGTAVGPMVVASPDAEAFLSGYEVPGMLLAASRQLAKAVDAPADYLDYVGSTIGTDGCTYAGRMDYDDGMYTGAVDVWTDCGETGAVIVAIAAEPPDGSILIEVLVQLVSEADEDALWTVIGSFMAR